MEGVVCAVDVASAAVGTRGFIIVVKDKAVVVLRVVTYAGGTG